MSIQRASLLTPCSRLEDLPSGLKGAAAAELLSAWTTLWHPVLIDATGGLPGWHSADDPPEPEKLEGELIVIPPISRERLPVDWCERMRATSPRNPFPVEARASRAQTVAETLAAAVLSESSVSADIAGDFLALGYAHLQVELLTRAMRYTTVLDADLFRTVVIEAARAAVAGDAAQAHDGLVNAFDQLTDARNHFYSVDYYLVDVTLLASTTLGDSLREKLTAGPPTNLLATGKLLAQLADEQPATLIELRRAVANDRACMICGPSDGANLAHRAPEGILEELAAGADAYRRILEKDPDVYGQFGGDYSPLLPEVLSGLGLQAALYTSFDGGRGERPAQPKARWGARGGPSIDILSAAPLDIAEAGTWLALGELIGDSLTRDHVATILLAGWPGQASEYYDDLRRIAAYGPVLGKFLRLDEYFRVTADIEDWNSFHPLHYPQQSTVGGAIPLLSARVDSYRQQVSKTFDQLRDGLAAVVQAIAGGDRQQAGGVSVGLNPWNFAGPRYIGFDPLNVRGEPGDQSARAILSDVPAWGFASLSERATDPPVPLAEGRTLRNEVIELLVSESTGGIQSLRSHRDRKTRVSQRLVMHDPRLPQETAASADTTAAPQPSTRMVADRIEITRNDAIMGEITSHGHLTDAAGRLLARFVQTMRLVRGLPAVIVEVELDTEFKPDGEIWNSYFASRLAWREQAVTVRCGVDWSARETSRRRIESPEWIEISDASGNMTCFSFGLPFHRLASDTWLDTLLATAGESPNLCQFAIGLDCLYPTQRALSLLTAGRPATVNFPSQPPSPRGWFLHASAKNVVVTHMQPLPPPAAGVRLRLLETGGRGVGTSLSAFHPFRTAWRTDFRGERVESLPVVEGGVEFEIGPSRWLQIEAEW